MPETHIELSKTGWAILGAIMLGALALFWGAITAGLAKFVLLCLRREGPAVKSYIEELFKEELIRRRATAEAAEEALERLTAFEGAVTEHGRELRHIRKETGEISELAKAIERMAEAQRELAKEMQGIGKSVLRMEEREAMREKWDGQERREAERRQS